MFDLMIDKDIKKASTLPGSFYNDKDYYEASLEKIFVKTWQFIGDVQNTVRLNEMVYPFTLLDGSVNEPLLITRNKAGDINCMSNVCTHRGNIVVNHPGPSKSLMCGYHGRRWELDGTFKNMPEFSEAENFPRPCDGLTKVPLKNWADQF